MMRKEIVYLGFIVSKDGLRADPKKIEAVKDWSQPKNVREVRAFCGFINHYRRFIKDCSVRMAPLTQLTRIQPLGKKLNFQKEWNCNGKCDRAFESLKAQMLDLPILRHADPERGFIIDVDSCEIGCGAVCSQIFDDGKEYPVAYFSKKYSKEEAVWAPTELEAIGVIKTLDHFRPMIYGTDFLVRTDNMAVNLSWLRKKTSGKLGRWAARLAEWDGYMTIIHRSGVKHGNADGLSRKGFAVGEVRPETDPNSMILGTKLPRDPVAHIGTRTYDEKKKEFVKIKSKNRTDISSKMINPGFRIDPNLSQLMGMVNDSEHMLLSNPDGLFNGMFVFTDEFLDKKEKNLQEMNVTNSFPDHHEELMLSLYKDLLFAQRRDIDLSDLRLKVEKKIQPRKNQDLSKFKIEKELLWQLVETEPVERWAVLVPPQMQAKVIALFHERSVLSHLGISKTYGLMKNRFRWKGRTSS